MATERNLKSEIIGKLRAVAELALGPEPTCAGLNPATVDDELRKAKIDPLKVTDTLQHILADAKARDERALAARHRETLLRASKGREGQPDSFGRRPILNQYYRGLERVSEADRITVKEDEALLDMLEAQMDGQSEPPNS